MIDSIHFCFQFSSSTINVSAFLPSAGEILPFIRRPQCDTERSHVSRVAFCTYWIEFFFRFVCCMSPFSLIRQQIRQAALLVSDNGNSYSVSSVNVGYAPSDVEKENFFLPEDDKKEK